MLHDALDAAVVAAYGWPADISDNEILRELLALKGGGGELAFDAVRCVYGFDGPVDSHSKRGNQRGKQGWRAVSKSFLMSDLPVFYD